jgi:serine/threonine protein kinase
VHRDLKPQNILIKQTDEGPVAKLTDFGISKMVDTDKSNSSSALMGTIEFMAPEQFNPEKYGINGKIGTNLDLWSFGLLVYTMETGHSLFGSQTGKYSAEQIMSNILSYDENKIEETVPDPLTRMVIQKCLVKDARKRIQKADELISVLENGSTISEDIRSHPPSSQTEVDETILLKPPVTSPPVQPKTPVFSPVARGVNTSQHEVARPEKQGFMTVIIVSVFLLICVILIIAKVSS